MQIHRVAAVRAQLGEGALWDGSRGLIWWVDIRSATLHCHHPASGMNLSQQLEWRLTALALTQRHELIACGDPGFIRLSIAQDWQIQTGEVLGCPDERPGNRFNDGKVDHRGHFWAGTMDDAELGAHGSLYRLDAACRLTRVRTGIRVPNGPCFLADGTLLTTDTPLRRITALQLGPSGEVVTERVFAHFDARQGYPDGMTVDAEDHVWVAFWDGWCVRRLSPTGQIVMEVSLPVQRPTCPTFGGPELRQIFVTSASTGLVAGELAEQPWAGSLLMFEPGVLGLAPGRFQG
jgi:xylono-1,5-lactonase